MVHVGKWASNNGLQLTGLAPAADAEVCAL